MEASLPFAHLAPSGWRSGVWRVVRCPLWLHTVALGLVLVAVLLLAVPDGVWTSDEGAVRAQVQLLSETGRWDAPRPWASIDPEEIMSPVHGSSIDGDRYAPYTKHVALPWLVEHTRVDGVGFTWYMVSLLGSLAAAAAAATIAGRIEPDLRSAALWAIGLSTPLFFYGYTVLGHTVAAACTTIAVAVLTGPAKHLPARCGLACGLVFVAGLFRAETAPFSIALAIGVAITAEMVHRHRILLSVALAAAGVSAWLINRALDTSVLGLSPEEGEALLDPFRFVSGAFSSLIFVDFGDPFILVALFLMTGGLALLALSIVREPDNRLFHLSLLAAAAIGALLLAFRIPVAVGGLLTAAPWVVAGLVVLSRSRVSRSDVRLILVTSAIFGLAVLSTQERGGGGAQWGGRYLLLVGPAVAAIAVVGIGDIMRAHRRDRVLLLAGLFVCSSVLAIDSLAVLRSGRAASVALVVELEDLATASAADDGVRTVVSHRTQVGRHAWSMLDSTDYLMVPEERFAEYVTRLNQAGLNHFGYFGPWGDDESSSIRRAGYVAVDPRPPSIVIRSP